MGTIRKKALERYELGDSVEVLDQVQPVLIVNPSSGAIDSGNQVEVTQVAKDRTISGTATVTQVAKDRKRGTGGLTDDATAGDGTNNKVNTVDLGSEKEISLIAITEWDASGTPVPTANTVKIEIGDNGGTYHPLQAFLAAINPQDLVPISCSIRARYVRTTWEVPNTGDIVKTTVGYWDV